MVSIWNILYHYPIKTTPAPIIWSGSIENSMSLLSGVRYPINLLNHFHQIILSDEIPLSLKTQNSFYLDYLLHLINQCLIMPYSSQCHTVSSLLVPMFPNTGFINRIFHGNLKRTIEREVIILIPFRLWFAMRILWIRNNLDANILKEAVSVTLVNFPTFSCGSCDTRSCL